MSECGSCLFRCTTIEPAETRVLGRTLGEHLSGGETIALTGQLGSGKTTLAGGILQGAGVDGPHRSPSFTLVREYLGRMPVFHVDLYRLDARSAADDLHWDAMLSAQAVTIIEWADRVARKFLPRETLHIQMRWPEDDRLDNALIRKITCRGSGHWKDILPRVAGRLEG